MKIRQINFLFLSIVFFCLAIGLYSVYLPKMHNYKYSATKILLVFNGDHYKEAENLLASMKKNTPKLVPLIVVCVSDENGKQFAQKHDLAYISMSSISKSGIFNTKEMNVMTRRKFEAILHLLDMHTNVMYIDTDIVLLSDPFTEINQNYDLNIQNDQCKPPYSNANLCTGFMFVKSSDKSKMFIEQAIEEIKNSGYKINDQQAVNLLISKNPESIEINLLNACKFPNGCRYFGATDDECDKSEAIIVHNNYLIGIDNKLARFGAHELLFTGQNKP